MKTRHSPAAVVLMLSLALSAAGQEYEFDLDAFSRKPFVLDGYLEARPSFFLFNPDSPFSLLAFYDRDSRKSMGEAAAALLANLTYRRGIFEALLEPYLDGAHSPLGSAAGAKLFQAYAALKPSSSLSLYAGKKALRWGKGYAWSPVAFVERPKNPNEPDLAREGYWMLTADYTKSFSGALKTLSITPVVVPVTGSMNGTYGRSEGWNFAGKIYLLLLDTDIDLVFAAGKSRGPRLGFDLSRNILSQWEVHGEFAFFWDLERRVVGADGATAVERRDVASFLLGMRYLSRTETTTILEYHHHGQGFTRPEMDAFAAFVDTGYERYLASGDDSQLLQAADLESYGGFTPMTDYVFLRIIQKDPFGILYWTPAVTVLCNLSDGSASWAPELAYTGMTNWEWRLKASVPTGRAGGEFREKRIRFRLELRARFFF
ncbi:MAG: hypothetical protein JW747_00150 [Candidatus Aminicenantes bacterium]|nr:hypothetical protein [Candidatus Aminicenantes bacterium]